MLLEAFRKNTRKSTRRIIVIVILAVIVLAAAVIILRLRPSGEGLLFTDFNAMKESMSAPETEGGLVTVTVKADEILIGKSSYPDVSTVRQALAKAAEEGKSFRLVDDYASAELYLGVLDILQTAGVEKDRIEEAKEP